MNTVEHIKRCVYEVQRLEGISTEEAYTKFLSYCAYESGVYGAVFKAKVDSSNFLHADFDVKELLGYDYLGDAYKELGFAKSKSIKNKLKDDEEKVKSITNQIIKYMYHDGIKVNLPTVFIQNVGTGKILFAAHNKFKEALIYAVESEKILYKIAIVNITLNKLPVKILNEIENPSETSPASKSWQMANVY